MLQHHTLLSLTIFLFCKPLFSLYISIIKLPFHYTIRFFKSQCKFSPTYMQKSHMQAGYLLFEITRRRFLLNANECVLYKDKTHSKTQNSLSIPYCLFAMKYHTILYFLNIFFSKSIKYVASSSIRSSVGLSIKLRNT